MATDTATNPLTQAAAAVDPTVGKQTGTSSSLSPWAGPYVTEMLGKGWALSDMPYQSYTGQLTAGPSALQNQAFQGLASLTTPTQFGQATGATTSAMEGLRSAQGSTFGPEQTQQYMSPYLQGALDPQIAEARRQAEIQRVQDAGRLTKAGAFGGSRQAIMESEGARNLLTNLADITGKGYQTAYEQARDQYNREQQQGLENLRTQLTGGRQFADIGTAEQGAGLKNLEAQMGSGATQRDITQQGLAADYAQFSEQRDFPYKQVQYMQSLLQGLPIETQTLSYAQPSTLSNILGSAGGIKSLYDTLFG
jgi:hypothetical protein